MRWVSHTPDLSRSLGRLVDRCAASQARRNPPPIVADHAQSKKHQGCKVKCCETQCRLARDGHRFAGGCRKNSADERSHDEIDLHLRYVERAVKSKLRTKRVVIILVPATFDTGWLSFSRLRWILGNVTKVGLTEERMEGVF